MDPKTKEGLERLAGILNTMREDLVWHDGWKLLSLMIDAEEDYHRIAGKRGRFVDYNLLRTICEHLQSSNCPPPLLMTSEGFGEYTIIWLTTDDVRVMLDCDIYKYSDTSTPPSVYVAVDNAATNESTRFSFPLVVAKETQP